MVRAMATPASKSITRAGRPLPVAARLGAIEAMASACGSNRAWFPTGCASKGRKRTLMHLIFAPNNPLMSLAAVSGAKILSSARTPNGLPKLPDASQTSRMLCLAITGFEADPERVTELLQIAPTYVARKGAVSRSGRPHRSNGWWLEATPAKLMDGGSHDTALNLIIERLELAVLAENRDGDSRIGEILIQPVGWAEASRSAEAVLTRPT